jgi:outer membrane protein assembly factor BamD (BamD/ComL family)
MPKVLTRTIFLFFLLISGLLTTNAQSGAISFDLKKPEKFENKKLGSEKTETKKWTVTRRFVQNGVTKFNWHFNARNRLAGVLERAKMMHRDDYTHLLTFYNYTLENTAMEKSELDSVIYKANAGILLHDLRNTWVDNLYMLMGQAYYFRNEPDSAYSTFQYINYAFAPKEEGGYDIPIGSNANEGNNAFTISTKEKNSLLNKAWTTPPSRNESFIWQIRTFLAKDEFAEAAGLIETLKNDPFFPSRLRTELYEVQAWWFYKREIFDSAAFYLEKALPNAFNREEKARWEYLIGQMYERSKHHEEASEFYQRSVNHTLDPVMELYGRLNAIRQNKGDEKVIQQNIEQVVKMAKRDRYTNYRDIIFYMAAQMELERNNVPGARAFLLRSTRFPSQNGDNRLKAQSFMQLADLSFQEKDYPEAKRFYDSAGVDGMHPADAEALANRREVLTTITAQLEIIGRQDSMLKIAGMPEAQREAFIRKLVKQLRKQRGLKEDDQVVAGGPAMNNDKDAPSDLFGSASKGEWYFSNNTLKSKGFNEFRNKWGNRPNVDNWRRQSAAIAAVNLQNNRGGVPVPGQTGVEGGQPVSDLSYEGLLKEVPLIPEQVQVRQDSTGNAKFLLGKAYMEGLEDYAAAITTLEEFIQKYPNKSQVPEALFYLRYCYTKTGNPGRAAEITAQLRQQYPNSEFEKQVSTPEKMSADSAAKLDMTKRYENIYTLFIEGRFDEALAAKKLADSLYNKSYWTPQLLYIESMYHIRQRDDVNGRKVLNDLITTFPESPMAAKAKALVDVLGRRKEIEDYLTNLQIERPTEDSIVLVNDIAPRVANRVPQQDSATVGTVKPVQNILPDSVIAKAQANEKARLDSLARLQQQTGADRKTPQVAPPPIVTQNQTNPALGAKDTLRTQPALPSVYRFDTAATHIVALVLDKVDQVYVTESRNAFMRYNRENRLTNAVNNIVLNDDVRLMLVDGFPNAAAALAYVEKAKKAAPADIIPWLPANKYSFIIISNNNLPVLTNLKDVAGYKTVLAQWYPGRF